MSETVSLYESIARNLGDVLVKGVATNCTGTAFQSSVLINRDALAFNGKDCYFYSGLGAGQSRAVGSFDPANRRIIVEDTFGTIATINTSFMIFDKFTTEDYESAMNRAIGKAKLIALQEFVGTIALVATQYDYAVPSGMEYIDGIRLVPSSGSDYANVDTIRRVVELPMRWWAVNGNQGGSRLIIFDSRYVNMDNYAGMICRVEGQSKYDFAGTQINAGVEEYVIQYASMVMSGQKEGKEWDRRFYMFRDELKGRGNDMGLETTITNYGRGRKVR
uniref:Uncharacterized protein n=1 Tax=viral metagenome TaxID=1070528 RepID=A0A6M3IZB8_9ZZZZ